jgi:hypothetical protein
VAQRSIDVGYRTRRMPFWLGRLGHEKWFIAQEFERRAKDTDLKLDLSTREGERLYGDAWTNFVASCRAVIGVESGASIIDFDGELERKVEEYMANKPNASFEEIAEQFLAPYEGSLKLNQISPRCFEAAALRTPMILFEGAYSGVLEPERHFIALRKDFTNFESVLSKLQDNSFLQYMADRTYEEVALNSEWTYRSFVQKVDAELEDAVAVRATQRASIAYSTIEFKRALCFSWNYYPRRKITMFIQSILLGFPFLRRLLYGVWESLPYTVKRFVRPFARVVSR